MLKDLIATRGEAAAARICGLFRYTGEARKELYDAIKAEVDEAYDAGRRLGRDEGWDKAITRYGRG